MFEFLGSPSLHRRAHPRQEHQLLSGRPSKPASHAGCHSGHGRVRFQSRFQGATFHAAFSLLLIFRVVQVHGGLRFVLAVKGSRAEVATGSCFHKSRLSAFYDDRVHWFFRLLLGRTRRRSMGSWRSLVGYSDLFEHGRSGVNDQRGRGTSDLPVRSRGRIFSRTEQYSAWWSKRSVPSVLVPS